MKTKSLPFILLTACLILIQNLQAQGSESEPNNTPAQANTLPLNGIGSGTNSPLGDVDWWKVTTNADGRLYITMSNDGTRDLKQVVLYDTGGVTYLNNAFVGNGVGGLVQDGLAAGTYYLKIFNNDVNPEISSYTIKDSLATLSQANDKEPNNNFMQADKIDLNGSITGHIGYYYNFHRDTSDWYKLTTHADGMLKITLDGSTNTSSNLVHLSLFDNNGTTLLANADVGEGLGGLNKDGLAAGTYYIQVRAEEDIGHAYTGYTLKDSSKTYKYAADAEPNTKPYQADSLPLNSSATGHVNFYYKNKRDTTDWYKLNYTGTNHKLKFTVKILPELIDNAVHGIHFDIYKDTLSNPISANGLFAATNKINLSSLTLGNYWIKIYPHDATTDWSAYSVTTSATITAPDPLGMQNVSQLNTTDSEIKWNIIGNAMANNLSVQLQLNTDANVSIKIVSVSGNLVQTIDKENMQKGNYSIPLNLNNALPGIYVVNLVIDRKVYSKNIMK